MYSVRYSNRNYQEYSNNHNYINENKFESKYLLNSVSYRFPLLFEITANKKHKIDYKRLIKNAYKYYEQIYDINKNINILIKDNNFRKDSQILHIALNHITEYKLEEIENKLENEIKIYELQKLSDLSDRLIDQFHYLDIYDDNKINYISFLFKEIKKYIKNIIE